MKNDKTESTAEELLDTTTTLLQKDLNTMEKDSPNYSGVTDIISRLLDHRLTYVKIKGGKPILVEQTPSPTREDRLRVKRFEQAYLRATM